MLGWGLFKETLIKLIEFDRTLHAMIYNFIVKLAHSFSLWEYRRFLTSDVCIFKIVFISGFLVLGRIPLSFFFLLIWRWIEIGKSVFLSLGLNALVLELILSIICIVRIFIALWICDLVSNSGTGIGELFIPLSKLDQSVEWLWFGGNNWDNLSDMSIKIGEWFEESS